MDLLKNLKVFKIVPSNYEALIRKKRTTTMDIKRRQILMTEIFKTIYKINPSYSKNIFSSKARTKLQRFFDRDQHHMKLSHSIQSIIPVSEGYLIYNKKKIEKKT